MKVTQWYNSNIKDYRNPSKAITFFKHEQRWSWSYESEYQRENSKRGAEYLRILSGKNFVANKTSLNIL